MELSGTTRVEAFSDAVFAIAATLLVLEFAVKKSAGAPSLSYQLLHQLWPSYLAYATSFLTIAIIWINHHHVMETIERIDRTFLFITALLLLVVAFIPFPTTLVAHSLQTHSDERAAVFAYGVTLLLMAIVFNVLWWYARRDRRLIREGFPDAKIRAVTLGLAFWSPVASVALTFAIAAFYLPSAALFDRVTD